MSDQPSSMGYRALWMKYCGLVDDYEMLKDRWRFLRYELESALPNLDNTFKKIDELSGELGSIFKVARDKGVSLNDLQASFDGKTYQDHEDLLKKFDALNLYIAKLKSAFVQRTFSLEIPEILTRLPQSPGRQIGGEMFFMAADNIARAYLDCLNISGVEWDGFVSFIPPTERTIVAVFTVGNLGLFHICFTEELRHYLSTNMLVAHELAHILIGRPGFIADEFKEALENERRAWDDLINPIGKCSHCPLNPYGWDTFISQYIFRELVADIIGFKIAGINYAYVLADHGMWPGSEFEIVPRLNGLLVFLDLSKTAEDKTKSLVVRLHEYQEMLETTGAPFPRQCVRCCSIIGTAWGATIFNLESNKSLLSQLVKHSYEIDCKTDGELKNDLAQGVIRTDVDPRLILSAYYDFLREDKHVNFGAVLHSLAFTSFKRN